MSVQPWKVVQHLLSTSVRRIVLTTSTAQCNSKDDGGDDKPTTSGVEDIHEKPDVSSSKHQNVDVEDDMNWLLGSLSGAVTMETKQTNLVESVAKQ